MHKLANALSIVPAAFSLFLVSIPVAYSQVCADYLTMGDLAGYKNCNAKRGSGRTISGMASSPQGSDDTQKKATKSVATAPLVTAKSKNVKKTKKESAEGSESKSAIAFVRQLQSGKSAQIKKNACEYIIPPTKGASSAENYCHTRGNGLRNSCLQDDPKDTSCKWQGQQEEIACRAIDYACKTGKLNAK